MSPKDDEGASSTTSSVSNTDQPQTPQLQGDNNPSQIINNEISQSGTVATAENNPVSTSQPAEKVEGTNNVPSEPSSLQPEIPSQPQIRTPAPGNAASEASTSAVASNLVSSQADPTSVAAQDSAVATRTTPQVDKVNLQEFDAGSTKKNKRTSIIIGLVALAVAILAGIFTWYFVVFNNPTRKVADAVSNLLTAKHLQVSGTLRFAPIDESTITSDVNGIEINIFNSSRMPAPSEQKGTIVVKRIDNDDLTLGFSYRISTDHVIFLKFDGLMDVFQEIEREQLAAGVYDDTTVRAKEYQDLKEILQKVDDEWWQISVPELVRHYGLDREIVTTYEDLFVCLEDYSQALLTDEKYANLYRQSPFLEVSEYDRSWDLDSVRSAQSQGTLYNVGFKSQEVADFANQLIDLDVTKDYQKCSRAATGSSESIDNVNPDDVTELVDDNQTKFVVAVDDWSHQLQGLFFKGEQSRTAITGGIEFTYEDYQYQSPEEYLPITDLIDLIASKMNEEDASELLALMILAAGGAYDLDDYYDNYDYYDDGYDDWYDEYEMELEN